MLGIESSANSVEIKRAYRKLALKHHPDKVSEEDRDHHEELFKDIKHAYEVLMDEDKRANYDMYGHEDGPRGGAGGYPGGGGFEDMFGGMGAGMGGNDFGPEDFAEFFGGPGMGGGRHSSSKQRKYQTDDIKLRTKLSLLDIYNGRMIKHDIEKFMICSKCSGVGLRKKAKPPSCPTCEGHGKLKRVHRMGGMMFMEDITCNSCTGSGLKIRYQDKCKSCTGEGKVKIKETLEFEIRPGMPSEGEIRLFGKSNEEYQLKTGDIVLMYSVTDNCGFERQNNDLYTKIKIKLVDALCGFKENHLVKTLDGRWISVKVPTGRVINPKDSIVITGEGMPILGSDDKKGDMIIGVDIEFPPNNWILEKNDIQTLKNVLDVKSKDQKTDTNYEDSEITYGDFTIKSKDELPKEFNAFNANVDTSNVGVNTKPSSWFGSWFQW